MVYSAMLCSAMLWYAILCYAMLCYTVMYCAVLLRMAPLNSVLFYSALSLKAGIVKTPLDFFKLRSRDLTAKQISLSDGDYRKYCF